MKIPEKPPNYKDGLSFEEQLKFTLNSDNLEAVKLQFSKGIDYLYWDEFKHRKMPNGLSPKEAWFYLKMSRVNKKRSLPFLRDEKGNMFWYCSTKEIDRLLHSVDREVPKKIESNFEINSEMRNRYLISSLMEEAIASSQIEGAATTRRIAKEMLRSGRRPKDESEQMILNNYRAIQEILNLKDQPMSLELLLNLHRMLVKDTHVKTQDTGRLRVEEDRVAGVDDSDGTQLFTPPSAKLLSQRLEKLIQFANEEEGPCEFIHPVIRAMILHFWLAYEHPFIDGNGRTARALFYWYMLKRGYWIFEFISISRILLKAPVQYARAYLHTEIDDNDLTYFLIFHLRAIEVALKELGHYFRKKQDEQEQVFFHLKDIQGISERQCYLIGEALKNPLFEISIQTHKEQSKIVYQTARTDLLGLVSLNLFKLVRRGKKYVFIRDENIRENINALKENTGPT